MYPHCSNHNLICFSSSLFSAIITVFTSLNKKKLLLSQGNNLRLLTCQLICHCLACCCHFFMSCYHSLLSVILSLLTVVWPLFFALPSCSSITIIVSLLIIVWPLISFTHQQLVIGSLLVVSLLHTLLLAVISWHIIHASSL